MDSKWNKNNAEREEEQNIINTNTLIYYTTLYIRYAHLQHTLYYISLEIFFPLLYSALAETQDYYYFK